MATATKTTLRKWISLLLISIVIIPTRLLCQMWVDSFEAEFLRTISKFRKRKKISSSLVYVHHKKWNWAFSRRSRAVTATKCTKKRDLRAELSLYLVNLLLFWRSRFRHRLGILESLKIWYERSHCYSNRIHFIFYCDRKCWSQWIIV